MALLHVQSPVIVRGQTTLSFPAFMLDEGKRMLLLGPSGCGKTTLLSMIAGLLAPQKGVIALDGQGLYRMPAARRDRLRGRKIGFVFQSFHLLPSLTVRQNIVLATTFGGSTVERDADDLMERLGLSALAHKRPDSLSQGEIQRAAIARALIGRPALVIADEPTSALDDANAAIVADLLAAETQARGAALLVATHDSRIMAGFERVLTLGDASDAGGHEQT